MLLGLGGFVFGFICLGWGSASAAGEAVTPQPQISVSPQFSSPCGPCPWCCWSPFMSMTLDESVGLEWGSMGLGHNPVGLRGSNPCPGLHTLQEVSGCHLLSLGSVRGSHRLGSDRREFLSFQLGSGRFVVAAGAAQVTKRRWEHEEIQAEE
ncbi:hypothetical protein DUI87_35233 [Hirundo rustica rustica]|uniref:MHC class I-like antigen recognition-like domain-containing protein n=1 Tax=Hirundo rustica rustica TaxID=333673 RepID=A0A3M0IK00_HIRRU|nr:hypothetical protein DUI87_35233 [Hirundo rustica rustica]